MCDWDNGHHIAAARYLSAAKKRNKELKKLKSVSRAYRKGEVRGLKASAARETALSDFEVQRRKDNAEQLLQLQAAHSASLNYSRAAGSKDYYNNGKLGGLLKLWPGYYTSQTQESGGRVCWR